MAFGYNGNGNSPASTGSVKYKTATGGVANTGPGIGAGAAPAVNVPGGAAFGATTFDTATGGMLHTKAGGQWSQQAIPRGGPAPAAPPQGPAPAAPPAGAPAAGPSTQAPPAPGVLGDKGYLGTLYEQRQDGNDPYYNALRTRGETAINNQAAARGGFNSSGALNAIGDYQTGIDARQFHDQADLAAAASGEQRNHFNDMWSHGADLSGMHTGAMSPLSGAGDALKNSDMQSIQMQLDKSGVDPKVQQQILQNMFGMAGAGATALGGIKTPGTQAPGGPPAPNPYDNPANSAKYNSMYDT